MHQSQPSIDQKDQPPALVQRLLRLRRVSDWSPVIVVAILYNSQLHLSLILATALSAGNLLADLIFKQCGYIKVWPKYLDVCFLLTYSITLILSYTIADSFVGRWLEVITEGGSCLLIVLGNLCGRPFTADIAKESVPEQFWGTQGFRRTAYMLSWLWAAIFLITTISYVIVAATRAKGDRSNGINIAFNYIIPIGILVAGILFTKWYSAHMRRKREAAMKAPPGSPSAAPGQPNMPKGVQGDLYAQKSVLKDGEHYDGVHAAPKAEV